MSSGSKMGMSFFFQQSPATINSVATTFPWEDMGPLEERTAKVEPDSETIMDDRNGKAVPVLVVENSFAQTYELTTPGISLKVLSWYYRSNPAAAPSPAIAGGTSTAVPHNLFYNKPVKIVDANGNGQVMVTSITSVTVGGNALVPNVDYAYVQDDLDRGFFYMLPTSTVVTSTASNTPIAATVTYVTSAVTGNVQMQPMSGGCAIQGLGEMHFANCQGAQKIRDRGLWVIQIPDLTLDQKKIARVKPTLTKLGNLGTGIPNDVLAYKGY